MRSPPEHHGLCRPRISHQVCLLSRFKGDGHRNKILQTSRISQISSQTSFPHCIASPRYRYTSYHLTLAHFLEFSPPLGISTFFALHILGAFSEQVPQRQIVQNMFYSHESISYRFLVTSFAFRDLLGKSRTSLILLAVLTSRTHGVATVW